MHAASIEDRIDIFAEAMRAQFGSRAAQIALDQSRHADGLVREVWLSVLHRIDQRYLPEKASHAPFARPWLNTIPPVVL